MTKDLTHGNEFKHILFFSIPLILGQFFQQLYNMVDRIVVGRYVGEDAIGAVGTSFPIIFFTTSLIMGIGMGATTVISQLYGARQYERLKRAVSTTLIFLGAASVAVGIIGFFIARPLLILLKVDSAILDDATIYLQIIFIGTPGSVLYNAYASLLRGLGNSKIPMVFLIIATLTNIALDLFFVLAFGWGVFGVAVATIISQLLSAVLSVLYVYKRVDFLKVGKGEWVFDRELFVKSVKLGIPSGIQQTILSIGFMSIQGLVNSYGKVMTSAITIASTIETIGTLPIMNIGLALMPFTGQNVGAGKLDRVRKGFHAALILNVIIYVVTVSLIYIFSHPLIRLFMPADADPSKMEQIVAYSQGYIAFVMFFIILMGIMFSVNSLLRGAGDVMIPLYTSIIALTVRVVSAYVMSGIPAISYKALWYSLPIGWVISTTISTCRYLSGKWKTKSVVRGLTPVVESDAGEITESLVQDAADTGDNPSA